MRKCDCPMREGAHEWHCGRVGEYDFVHCKDCDGVAWMCGVAFSRCKGCRIKWQNSEEYRQQEKEAVEEVLKRFIEYGGEG